MPVIQPDLSQVGPITPGTYVAKVVNVEVKISSKGNPMIVPDFEIEIPSEDDPRKRSSWLVTEGPGAYGFGQFLRACGLGEYADKYEDKDVENPSFDTDLLLGAVLNVVIEEKIYEDQKRDQITTYLKL